MRRPRPQRIPNWLIGIVLIVVLAVGGYLAFTKSLPWGGGPEVRVVFRSGHDLRKNSPVRIAGVDVGKVKTVEPLAESDVAASAAAATPATVSGQGAVVTMEMDDDAPPLKEDARFAMRPRLFLEGNLFIDVEPGSPSAPVAGPDYVFPPQQTSTSVQIDQILTGVFPKDVRRQLQIVLDQLGNALVTGEGGRSLRRFNRVSAGAFKHTAEVSEALLGSNPHDLSSLVRNLDRVLRGLNGNDEALADLITNLRITTGSFAAQDVALERAIAELPGTLDAGDRAFASLNAAFPPTRAFAREILPGIRTAPATLDAATPLLAQLRGLARPAELGGLAADLLPTVPRLARLSRDAVPLMEQTRALSSCINHTILPWLDDSVSGGPVYDAGHGANGTVYQETAYGLTGLNGESRTGDANGQYIRVFGGGGSNIVQSTDLSSGDLLAGVTPLPIQGSMPPLAPKPPFRPGAPCENQDPPNLTASIGPAPPQPAAAGAAPAPGSAAAPLIADANAALTGLGRAAQAGERGDGAKARELQRRALRDLERFYAGYDGGASR